MKSTFTSKTSVRTNKEHKFSAENFVQIIFSCHFYKKLKETISASENFRGERELKIKTRDLRITSISQIKRNLQSPPDSGGV